MPSADAQLWRGVSAGRLYGSSVLWRAAEFGMVANAKVENGVR
jgi:hypothetical protein